IEAIESKLAGSLTPADGDTFVVNGAPFNGTGSGYYYNASNTSDTSNYGINATFAAPDYTNMLGNNANNNIAPLAAVPASLLPNYAAYDAYTSALYTSYSDGTARSSVGYAVDAGGLDE